jgi:hypothetical protein
MAGINQGTPETAVGEPIRLGNSDEFEIEQHPASDRLIIRDTVNGKVAYVRKERGGEIGGDGVLIKALKEGKPMADDGRTYDTIQEAERQASSWVFVPPGTFNENVTINTKGLTLRGSGYNTIIESSNTVMDVNISNFSVENLRIRASSGSPDGILSGDNANITNISFVGVYKAISGGESVTVTNCYFDSITQYAVQVSNGGIVSSCHFTNSPNSSDTIRTANDWIIANNVMDDVGEEGIKVPNGTDDVIIIGNRIVTSSALSAITIGTGSNNMVANNRISNSSGPAIDDIGTGTLLDANLTGASN